MQTALVGFRYVELPYPFNLRAQGVSARGSVRSRCAGQLASSAKLGAFGESAWIRSLQGGEDSTLTHFMAAITVKIRSDGLDREHVGLRQ